LGGNLRQNCCVKTVQSPNLHWTSAETTATERGASLRRMLLEAIDHLYSERLNANSQALRRYQILRQQFFRQRRLLE
jgi:hypothetical protein